MKRRPRSGWHFLVPVGFLTAALIYPDVFQLRPEKAATVATLLSMLFALIFGFRGKRASIPGSCAPSSKRAASPSTSS